MRSRLPPRKLTGGRLAHALAPGNEFGPIRVGAPLLGGATVVAPVEDRSVYANSPFGFRNLTT